MKKLIIWIKEHGNYFKMIFIISVLVIVVSELFVIGKTISIKQLESILSDIAVWKILLMLIIGLLSILPMIFYDIILNNLLEQKLKPLFLFETSWIVNTINNMVGFGGLTSIGLRSGFYGKEVKEVEEKKLGQSLSKIFIFLMSGLSIYSLISFLLIILFNTNSYIKQYSICLIIGGLYFPIVLIVTTLKKDEYIGNMLTKTKMELLLTSFLEWTGTIITFFIVGYFMDIQFNPLHVFPLFIASSVIGIISMIPGELGSFEVIMIMGLSTLGIPKETAVVWILLYRIFYYIIPFIIGVFFLIKNISLNLNMKYSGIPRELALEISHKILVFLMYFSGIIIVLSATVPDAFSKIKLLHQLNPLQFHIIVQFPAILLGFLLLIMGRGISARVKKTYWPTIILILATLLYTFVKHFNLSIILFLFVLLIIVIISKSELFREQLVYSWEMITIDGIIFAILIILYITIGIYSLPIAPHHSHFISFFLFPSEKIWFSEFLAILFVALVLYLFIKYLQGNKHQIGIKFDEKLIVPIIENYGGNNNTHLVFLGDKDIFIYKNKDSESTVFLQFKTFNNKCIVMGDPSGKQEDFPDALENFINETDKWGYVPVFYEVSEKIVMLLHEFGYDFIKMGEEAHVDLPSFTVSGKKRKSERAVMNRFEKEQYTFEVISPPFSSEFIKNIKSISDEWLGNRKEKGFSLGFFSEKYFEHSPIAIARDKNNEIIAFANIIPTYDKTEGTIDLMRYKKDSPPGVMDFLFISLFRYMLGIGLTSFNLGMAPLSNVGTSRKSFIQERIAYFVYEFGSHFYSFRGLRYYKEKFATNWVSYYTLYSRNSFIIYVMIALLIIDNAPVEKQKNYNKIKRLIKIIYRH